MSSEGRHAGTADYISDFQQLVERELPEEEPGAATLSTLIDIYISRDNKRHIEIFIQTGPQSVLRVRYIMPMSAVAARALYDQEGLQPHTPPLFFQHPIPVGQTASAVAVTWAATNNVSQWSAELTRVTEIEAGLEAGTRKRRTGNLIHYWRIMRRAILRALHEIYVGEQVSSSSNRASRASTPRLLSTSPRRSTPNPQ
jgi:hypothetical protein